MKNRENDLFAGFQEKLRTWLQEQQISQKNFSDQYFLEEVDPHASEDALDKHFQRFKALLKKSYPRAPETLAAHVNYFIRKYRKDGIHTQMDRQAAWKMMVELDTRIATRPLVNGQLSAAVKSLADLFLHHRNIAKECGADCKLYYKTVNEIFERDLRPFTSKQHRNEADIDATEFHSELTKLQVILISLKEKLYDISK